MKKLFQISILCLVLFSFLNKKNQKFILNFINKNFDTDLSLGKNQFEENNSSFGGGSNSELFDESKYKNYSKESIEYFKEIALGREFGSDSKVLKRWSQNMKIYVDGKTNDKLDKELKQIVSELNKLINTIDIEIVSDISESNMYIYFGSYLDFHKIKPKTDLDILKSNLGYFNKKDNSGYMYVDIYRTNIEEQKHLLREELTQSLGLFDDSYKYPESIFYQGWSTTTEYAPIDREVIDMLYNN